MSVMHTSRILAIFYMQKWNKLCSVVPCSFWNVDTIFLCSRIMKINWQWNQHIRDRSNIFYREISSIVLEKSIHIEEPELLCACGRPADLKTAGVDSNPDCHFFKAHHPVWVFHIEFPFYSRHYIFFRHATLDITLSLFHVVSRACIVQWNVHALYGVSPHTFHITLILVHGVSVVAC